jgi:hypothetical protein
MTTIQAHAIEAREPFIEGMNAPRLLAALRRFARESDLAFEGPMNKAEDTAHLAVARHFIAECRRNGTDPAQVLRAVVTHWRAIRVGVLKAHDGRAVFLPPGVCFLSFYRWRREIAAWLEVHHGRFTLDS